MIDLMAKPHVRRDRVFFLATRSDGHHERWCLVVLWFGAIRTMRTILFVYFEELLWLPAPFSIPPRSCG